MCEHIRPDEISLLKFKYSATMLIFSTVQSTIFIGDVEGIKKRMST